MSHSGKLISSLMAVHSWSLNLELYRFLAAVLKFLSTECGMWPITVQYGRRICKNNCAIMNRAPLIRHECYDYIPSTYIFGSGIFCQYIHRMYTTHGRSIEYIFCMPCQVYADYIQNVSKSVQIQLKMILSYKNQPRIIFGRV